jgi:L-tyrosine isonitrile synthase
MPDQVAYAAAAAVEFSSACDHELPSAIIYECAPPIAGIDTASGPGPRDKRRRPAAKSPAATAEQVLRSFNTWAFKREQPSDPKLLQQAVAAALELHAPIPFVLYWGKGRRNRSEGPELQCLDYLGALTARVRDVYEPGAKITLICTDTHAELNGHCKQDIQQYFDDVRLVAEQRGFETCWLGPLVKAAGNLATVTPLDEIVPAETLASLTASAQKWYRGGATAQEGALTYLRMNLIEQRVVERAFPGSIFITFNGGKMRCLFPKQLPIFYMYSLRRGVSVKPWFLPGEAAQFDFNVDQANPPRPDAA